MEKMDNSQVVKETKPPEKEPSTPSEAFSAILIAVGGFGRWQFKIILLLSSGIVSNLQTYIAVFLAASPDHWCQLPSLNLTKEESFDLINQTIPWTTNKDGDLAPSQCSYYDLDYENSSLRDIFTSDENLEYYNLTRVQNDQWEEKACDSWHYDTSIYRSTLVTEWDLVCDRKWLQPSIQASYMVGALFGSLIFSSISDSYGRRFSTLVCLVIFALSSILAMFSTSLEIYLVLRLVSAASNFGLYLVTQVLGMEVSEGRGRTWVPIISFQWAQVGTILLAIMAYFLREWRQLQLFTSVPILVYLSYFWILPESPRWLFMKGRFDEGLIILKQIADSNGRSLPDDQTLNRYIEIIEKGRDRKPKMSFKQAFTNFFNGVVSKLIMIHCKNLGKL